MFEIGKLYTVRLAYHLNLYSPEFWDHREEEDNMLVSHSYHRGGFTSKETDEVFLVLDMAVTKSNYVCYKILFLNKIYVFCYYDGISRSTFGALS